MKFPIIELVDRYAISVVKYSKTNGANHEEVEFYIKQLKAYNLNTHHKLLKELIEHHKTVWQLEDQFKKGTVDKLPLEEIGKMAIQIRNYGRERSRIKNELAEIFDDSIRDIKQYNGIDIDQLV